MRSEARDRPRGDHREHPPAATSWPATRGVMAVVKADGYGHGLLPERPRRARRRRGLARASRSSRRRWRCAPAGIDAPVLAWLLVARRGPRRRRSRPASTSASTTWPSSRRVQAAAARHRPHGPGAPQGRHRAVARRRAARADWPELCAAAARRPTGVEVVGRVEPLRLRRRRARPPGQPRAGRGVRRGPRGGRAGRGCGPRCGTWPTRAATLTAPATPLRPRAPRRRASTGCRRCRSSGSPADFGLRPAMTLASTVALVKRVPAGRRRQLPAPLHTDRETTLALVPLGYADGVPRARRPTRCRCSSAAGAAPSPGTVCMDQFVLDVGDDEAAAGDEVLLFGPGDAGRADRAGVGRRARHHRLRDRHPGRRARAARRTGEAWRGARQAGGLGGRSVVDAAARGRASRPSATPSAGPGCAPTPRPTSRSSAARRPQRAPSSPTTASPLHVEEVGARRTRRSPWCSATATPSSSPCGTSSGRRSRPTTRAGSCCTTSARTAAAAAGRPGALAPSTSSAATSPRCSTAIAPTGPRGARRPLDGRHDDHGAGRPAPRAVRRPGRRRRACSAPPRAGSSELTFGLPARSRRSTRRALPCVTRGMRAPAAAVRARPPARHRPRLPADPARRAFGSGDVSPAVVEFVERMTAAHARST